MSRPLTITLLSALLVLGVAGCAPSAETPAPEPAPVDGGPAAGMRLAPGMYDQEDGTVVVLGTLEWIDLEGGFWAIIDGSQSDNAGGTIAVISDPTGFEGELDALKGLPVSATGTRFDGSSIRMAGPEIELATIEEVTDTPGPAE